jgi:hypothetical protein
MSRLFLSLFSLCAIAVGIHWLGVGVFPNVESKPSPAITDGGQKESMYQSIEEKARKAKGNDESAIRELADAALDDNKVGVIPTEMLNEMKERLIRAEIRYRNGKKGVHEIAIVRLINDLVDKFGAPDYAKTSPLQVRTMRVCLKQFFPSFIAQEADEKSKGLRKEIGARINPEMSPLEAAYIATMLIWQKILNKDWQVAPEKWTPDSLRKNDAETAANSEPHLTLMGGNEKATEMMRLITRRGASLSRTDMRNLIQTSLDTLEIEEEEQ